MACVHVVTDGSIALPSSAAHDYGIRIVPRVLVVGGAPFTLDAPSKLDDLLARADATTEPIAFGASDPTAYRDVFAEILGWGVEVLSVHGPAALGGDAEAARLAASSLDALSQVTVVETPWPSAALGMLALRAAVLGQDEMPRTELRRLVDGSTIQPAFLLVGGSARAAARAGTLPSVENPGTEEARPLLRLAGGRLSVAAWFDSISDALRGLAEIVAEEIGSAESPTHLALVSAGADAEIAALAAFLESRLYPSEIWLGAVDAVSGAIGGRGAFGIAFYADPAPE
jgi:fatty acid-binding protein DegV